MIENIRVGSVLVVGDTILDCSVEGIQSRFSAETPIPVFDAKNISYSLGGAGNVANNLLAAHQNVILCTVIGTDFGSEQILRLMRKIGLGTQAVFGDTSRKTTIKTRYCSEQGIQIFRSDYEDRHQLNEQINAKIVNYVAKNIDSFDLVLLSDYQKGCLSVENIKKIVEISHQHQIPVWADVKSVDVHKYKGCDLIKPNKKEFLEILGINELSLEVMSKYASKLCEKNNHKHIIITLGAEGMMLAQKQSGYELVPAIKVNAIDVSGAGDTAFSYLAVGKVSGFSISDSMMLANLAAGISVKKRGASPVSLEEIKFSVCKKVDRQDVFALVQYLCGKKIVFTNGCFDLLHAGHISSLKQAAELGDVLIVGINTDASIERLKGLGRPVIALEERIAVLEALECVDYVIPFEEDTPLELIRELLPKVLVKSKDYENKFVVGSDLVIANGGELVLVDYLEGYSTTNIVMKLEKR